MSRSRRRHLARIAVGTNVQKDAAYVNEPGTARIQGIARMMQDSPGGTSSIAYGTRPNPGVLPPADQGEPDPLRFQFPWGGNLQYTPRTGFGTPFTTLRGLASTSPEIFMCISVRKDQMAALHWDWQPRDRKDTSDATKAKINQARAFFAKPDKVTPLKTWLGMLVDEVLTIDALSIFKRKTRKGDVYGYEIIDGSTIKVLVNGLGQIPLPPEKAYRQIIYGAPMAGGDMSRDELMYLPKNVRTWTPYGMSPTEALLLIVTAALNRTMYNLSYYVKGNIPEALVGVPDTWSPKQIRQFMEYWNAVLRGDPNNRAGLRFVTETMAKNVHEFKDKDNNTNWEVWLLKMICACFGVTPTEVGFTDDVNRATSETQGDVNQRRGVKPMANYVKDIFDAILATDLGMPELETTFTGHEGDDAKTQAQVDEIHVRTGIKSLDEIRTRNGDSPVGVGPAIVTAMGAILWKDAVEQSATPPEAPATDTNPPADDVKSKKAPVTDDPQQEDLAKYFTVARRAVLEKRPVRKFRSAHISSRILKHLEAVLTVAKTEDDVIKAFMPVYKAQSLNRGQKADQSKMNAKLATVLGDMRKAFVKHLGV